MIGICANFHMSYPTVKQPLQYKLYKTFGKKLETLKLHRPYRCLDYFVHLRANLHKNALIGLRGVTHSICHGRKVMPLV